GGTGARGHRPHPSPGRRGGRPPARSLRERSPPSRSGFHPLAPAGLPRYPRSMERWMSLRVLSIGAALLAGGCASHPPPPRAASSSADLDAWLDRTEDRGPARSTTLRGPVAMPETEAPARAWSTRIIHAREPEPPRPKRRAPVDVSFNKSDMTNAFQF